MNFRLETVNVFASVPTCEKYHYKGHAIRLGYPRQEDHVRHLPFLVHLRTLRYGLVISTKQRREFFLPGLIL